MKIGALGLGIGIDEFEIDVLGIIAEGLEQILRLSLPLRLICRVRVKTLDRDRFIEVLQNILCLPGEAERPGFRQVYPQRVPFRDEPDKNKYGKKNNG